MKALVLQEKLKLSLQEIDVPEELGPGDVRIRVMRVGICGSDLHYYKHGKIGHYVITAPMVLGHEAAGVVTETGWEVKHLRPGDRVCMEPGIPDVSSRASRLGHYNIDPSVTFWATPPIHGCLTPSVVHPAAFTYKLPDNVSFAEGAMVEPFAIGMQAATKAGLKPGDTAAVVGAGTIGIMVALATLAGGAARVILADLATEKLAVAGRYQGIIPVNIRDTSLTETVSELTGGWGADVVFEASGSPTAYDNLIDLVAPAGTLVLVGCPVNRVPFDVIRALSKEIRIETVFRYANVYDKAISLISSGRVDLKPLLSGTFPFGQGVQAFERAAEGRPSDIKLQIDLEDIG
ncbi:MAG: NAD(P)-dependent alcohol dehydrogenase [Terriglobia bacterium]|jgi:D-xylulose reductase